MDILQRISEEMGIALSKLEKTVELLDEGNTVPFIARYRKEVTGGLDDTVLRDLTDRLGYLRNLEARKEEVKNLIEAQGNLTPELVEAIDAAQTITEVDDIYRPFRPKRKTRASVAKERGLEPLANLIMQMLPEYESPIEAQAEAYVDAEKGVESAKDALDGACDIIAEAVSDNADYRREIRGLTFNYGTISSTKAGEGESVYEIYYNFSEKLKTVPSHRILAMNRGEKEDILKVSVSVDTDIILNYLFANVITNYTSPAFRYVSRAICDSYDRLIAPSIEREIRSTLFDNASESAIKLFSENLKNLLMQSPLKGKTVLGYDPGFRTGCTPPSLTKRSLRASAS